MARPLGELRGETEQANELARWLRRVTNGVGVRRLEADFPYSKSMWSQFRNGSRLLPRDLLGQVVSRYLHEPAMRQRQLDVGLRLLDAALRSADALPDRGTELKPVARPPHLDALAQAALRLDDARLRQMEVMRRLADSERRCERLENLVTALEQRCVLLERQRDRARDEVRGELQRALEMSAEYRRQANHKLKRARLARMEAYELRLAAEAQVARAQLDLPRDSLAEAGGGTALVPPSETARNLASLDGLVPALHAIDEEMDEHDRGMDALRADMRLPAADRPVHDATLLRVRLPAGGSDDRDVENGGGGQDAGGAMASVSRSATPRRARTSTAALGCAAMVALGITLAWDPLPTTGGHDAGRLKIGMAVDAPGLSTQEHGTFSGFEVAMTAHLAESLGFADGFVLVPVSTEERFSALREGRVDMVVAHDEITAERLRQVDFVGPYMRTYHGVLVRKGDKRVSSFADLAGRIICTREHATEQEGLIKGSHAQVVIRPNTDQCIRALRTGAADAVLDNQVALYGYTQKYEDTEVPPAATDGQPVGSFGIALPKGTSADLCKRVFRALQEYLRDRWEEDFRTHLPSVVQAFPTTWNAFTPPEGDMEQRSSCAP
ncbi:transporter substrate-binding domain-containing protein [Streptomyces sp. NPDC055796]